MNEFILIIVVFTWLFGYTFNIYLLEFDEDESIGSFIALFVIWPIFDILVIIIIICYLINKKLTQIYKRKTNGK